MDKHLENALKDRVDYLDLYKIILEHASALTILQLKLEKLEIEFKKLSDRTLN